MTFGIIVEGPSDVAVYPILMQRIRPAIRRVISRPCGGKSPLGRKFIGFLKEFEDLGIEKALVIRDSDCKEPRIVEGTLAERLRASGFQPTHPCHFYAASCMLDGWLLADESAVNQVARNRGKRPSAQPFAGTPQGERNARALFRRMLSQAGLPADPAVYSEVAAVANLERVQQRCLYFQHFVECVHAC